MDPSFLGVPDVDVWLFAGLAVAAFITTFLGATTGTAGGVALLAVMALFFPPIILVPVHTFVQLGAGISRAIIMWQFVLRSTLVPFLIGAVIGATAGAQIFITLPTGILQGLIGISIVFFTWVPRFSRLGGERGRFFIVGAVATFFGMFVSATGSLVAAFTAGASPNRRNLLATQGALMVMVHTTKIVAFAILGMAVARYTPLILVMIAAAASANWVGSRVIGHIPEKSFRIIFKIFVTVVATRLFWAAGVELGLI